jgi:Right handed beta helix region
MYVLRRWRATRRAACSATARNSAREGSLATYVADSPNANAVLIGNRVFRNSIEEGIGLFLRDASHGVVRDTGLRATAPGSGSSTARFPVRRATGSRENVVRDNTASCPPSEAIPVPVSGSGIALSGTDHVVVDANRVTGNHPIGDTLFAGGIVVASTTAFGGADPTNNLVRDSRARNNEPADLVYDGRGAGNRFINNDCATSIPAGICDRR